MSNKYKYSRGLTLIELLVTLAVIVILAGLAVPNFSTFLGNARAQAEYRELFQTLQYARSEAIARSQAVRVTALQDDDWHQGWRVWVDANNNGSFDAGEELREATGFGTGSTLTSAGLSTITFNPQGFLNIGLGNTVAFNYRTDPEYCARDRDIRLTHTGHASIAERTCE